MHAYAALIPWPQPILEFLGFVAAFLATGAIGFRFIVVRPWIRGNARTTPGDFRMVAHEAAQRAAAIAFIGAALALTLFVLDVHAQASERHLPFGQVFGADAAIPLEAGLGLLSIIGFGLAIVGVGPGWHLAAAGVILGALRPAFFGQWARLINPIHMLAGGMWIGTLFYVVVAGIWLTLRSGLSPDRRGLFVREIVARFSPFALVSAGVLATFGVITAWRHLHTLSALWTTPYGVTLIVKLCVVATVLALGAFNFRRQRPLLGSESGARALRRSAAAELLVAMLVLAVTSILVSLPSPKPPPHRPSPGASAVVPHRAG